ncbi:hypothetical protein ACFLU3_04470 [Chloroflexota bacterium]
MKRSSFKYGGAFALAMAMLLSLILALPAMGNSQLRIGYGGYGQQYTITATDGPNGIIAPDGAVIVTAGNNQGFSITPAPGFQIADVLVDSVSVGAVPSYDFINVQADHTIHATFVQTPQYTITATDGPNGIIAPDGAVIVTAGNNQGFSITPAPGFQIADVLVDSVSVGAVPSYDFINVQTDHTIHATFALIPPP